MKKLSLLAGTIGSTAAWYILSNKKLRTELAQAEDPSTTIKILSRYIGRDAEKIGKEVYEFMHSEEVQEKILQAKGLAEKNLGSAKKLAEKNFTKAKNAWGSLLKKGKVAACERTSTTERRDAEPS